MSNLDLDYDAIGKILKENCRPIITELGKEVAAKVKADPNVKGAPAFSYDYVTDRAASNVVLASHEGMSMQAKHGVLTKAAASMGLEVRSK